MAEERFVKPGKLKRELSSRARKALLRAAKRSPMDAVKRRRAARLRAALAHASASLPDGTTPKLRAALMAAQRRNAQDPQVQETFRRAAMAKRVQMAKQEAGVSAQGAPERFMGLNQEELDLEIRNALPPPMKAIRPQKAQPKKGKTSPKT